VVFIILWSLVYSMSKTHWSIDTSLLLWHSTPVLPPKMCQFPLNLILLCYVSLVQSSLPLLAVFTSRCVISFGSLSSFVRETSPNHLGLLSLIICFSFCRAVCSLTFSFQTLFFQEMPSICFSNKNYYTEA